MSLGSFVLVATNVNITANLPNDQLPATRGCVRKDWLVKDFKFAQDQTTGQQMYARHPETGVVWSKNNVSFNCNGFLFFIEGC